MKKLILITIVILCTATATAQNFTQDSINYEVIVGTTTVAITSQTTATGDVIIPTTVTDNDITYTVTQIGRKAFRNNGLTSVTIPDTIIQIGEDAFQNNELTSVTIPDSVTIIGIRSFQDNQLTSITIPDSVTTISNAAFGGNQLKQLTIPNSITSIDAYAFAGNQLKQLTIPNSVTSIGLGAFDRNQLKQLTIPNSITSIDAYAFAGNQLKQLTIPNSVTSIGKFAFHTNQLTQLTIPKSITNIELRAFQNNPLTQVIALGVNPPVIATGDIIDIFDTFDDRSTIDVFVPPGTKDAYLDNGWEGFKSIEEISLLPVITLEGAPQITVELGDTFTDPGATAIDVNDEDITDIIDIDNPVDTAVVGTYTITYNVTNTAGNKADQVIRTVNVVDTTPPVITLNGDNPQIIPLDGDYKELGATVTDLSTTDINPVIDSSTVDTSVLGEYQVTYNATDASGNAAVQVTRTVNVVDITPPVITLNGDDPVRIELNTTFTDPGATAVDNVDGDITINIDTDNPVNTSALGTYTVTYTVTDAAENEATLTRTVQVVQEATAPVITLLGDLQITLELGDTFTDPGATAVDSNGVDITNNIDTDNPVDTSVLGTYTITYNVTDASGNAAVEVNRTVNVVDTTPPVITLLGDNPVRIELNTTFTDPGATAVDNVDGDITTNIDTDNPVDTSVLGTYTVTYTVIDAAENEATLTRTVQVVQEATAPVITLLGDLQITLELGDTFTDPGATAVDSNGVDITNNIITNNPVDTAIAGIYTITYNVTDASGNAAVEVNRTVNVVDTTPPVITLLGDNPVRIELNTTFTDPGATAVDNVDGDITTNIDTDNPVNTSILGTYTVTYTVTDAAENEATLTRTVQVVQEATAPVITLLGDQQITLELGDTFTDPGATAVDSNGVDITNDIITNNPVDTSVLGTYTITYNVTDASGNPAIPVDRTVLILADATPPVITLLGDNPVRIELNTTFTDPGATAVDNVDGDITTSIDTDNPVDTSVIGTYTITYTVIDTAGNTASLTRTVQVVQETTAPVITLLRGQQITLELGDTFTDPGATAVDSNGVDITNDIITNNPVDTAIAGTYTITYNVTDASGNAAVEVNRTVNVVDTTPPVITLLGDNPQRIQIGADYIELGATVTDLSAGDINPVIDSSAINTSVAGSYTVTYNATDASGNPAIPVDRTVLVLEDATPPVITLLGDNPQRIQIGAEYIELGATALDTVDGDITENLTIDSNAVDTSVIGTYTVTYTVIDAAGNTATLTRTVIVVDLCPITNLDPDHFTLQSLAETCSGKNNGAIRINAKTELDYILTINEHRVAFTSEILIHDLAPATYPICITVDGFSNCQQCFEVVINPGINIAGTTAIQQQAFGATKLQVAIQTGTPPYTVYVNGLQKTVSQNKNFSIPVANGDQVEVSSALECQGKLTTKVQLEDELQLYPNPTQGDVTLTLGTTALKNIQVVIYNPLGIAVSKAKLSVTNRQVIIPMSTLPKGAYILQLPEIGRTFKVIKN